MVEEEEGRWGPGRVTPSRLGNVTLKHQTTIERSFGGEAPPYSLGQRLPMSTRLKTVSERRSSRARTRTVFTFIRTMCGPNILDPPCCREERRDKKKKTEWEEGKIEMVGRGLCFWDIKINLLLIFR